MPISPYIAHLRQSIGHELILLPSVAVLVYDGAGRLLLVRQADTGAWGTIGGAVEVDEDPAVAAVREAEEEAGVRVELTRLVTALGGPQFRLTYPNGDRTSYVSIVYEARVVGGTPRPDDDETIEVGWFALDELPKLELGGFARHSFRALGLLPAWSSDSVPGSEPDAASPDGPPASSTGSVLASLRHSYDSHAADRAAMPDSTWKQDQRARFAGRLREAGARRVLEIGAGHGVSGRYFADAGFDVLCTDLSPELVARCRALGLPAQVMDFGALDYPAASFDAVFGMNCLLHVPRARLPQVLASVHHVLTADGLFYWGQHTSAEPFEGIWSQDSYEPKRFFCFLTDEEMLAAAETGYEVVEASRVALPGDSHDFGSLVLRRHDQ